ncbi:MAG TPA: MarR family transcriptional regulator, partial [Sphingomonadaceae bacterium]|nr:MarR family transcriptional regulator [Sphingomonadaceae bacterium]
RMEAMSAILKTPGTKPQVEIAKRLRIEGPTLTRMLDTLEKDGLVERLPDPNDRRTKQLRLTGKGERTLEEIFEIAAGLRARLFDGIDIGDLEKVNAILGEVLDRLDGGLRDPE